jgi:cytochrome P450
VTSTFDVESYDPSSYDPRSPEVKQNIEEHFAALRQKCPVHHHKFSEADLKEINDNPYVAGPTTDLYSFLKYRDVEEILQSPDKFLSIEGAGPERMTPVAGTGMLVWSDGEPHRRSRKICQPSFTPKNINKLAPQLQERIDDLIDGFAGRGSLDLMAVSQFLGAGIESSATAICNGIHLLCTNPGERAKLEADPSLIGTAVEEVLRFMAPIEGTCRTAAEDVEIGGVQLKKGQKIRPVKASANMDEEVFSDAAVFKVDRDRSELRKHVTFGMGVHSCLGAALARQELKLAIGTLIRRIPTLALDPSKQPTRNKIFLVHGWDYLPVVWDPASVLPRQDAETAVKAASVEVSAG